jgi:hypothetical protein
MSSNDLQKPNRFTRAYRWLIGRREPGVAREGRFRDESVARAVLTYTLCILLLGSVVASWFFYARAGTDDAQFRNLQTIVGVILTPAFSVFSAAVGFYYGERKGREEGPRRDPPSGTKAEEKDSKNGSDEGS